MNTRKAFAGFDPRRVASYSRTEVRHLLANQGIVRNRLKITAAIVNAQRFLEIQKTYGSFDKYVWAFVGGRPRKHRFRRLVEIPATTHESDALSEDLHRHGFRFVGSTICYAFMQAVGLVNDHVLECFRYDEV